MRVTIRVPVFMGKARPRVVRSRSGATHSYTPRATAEAEALVREAYEASVPGPYPTFPDGPVRVRVDCMRPLPKSRPKRVEWEHDVYKPDADNIAKLVLDALNGVAWGDDAQVVDLSVAKCCRERGRSEPQTVVTVEQKDYWRKDDQR